MPLRAASGPVCGHGAGNRGDRSRSEAHALDDDLLRRLNGETPTPETWKPNPGDVLIGWVVDLDEVEGQYGSYPVVVVERGDGERLAWHAKPAVARYELSRAAPEIGDRLAIRYDGIPALRSYHAFLVVGEPRRIDWSRYRKPTKG